jgi:nuclear receptor coactivator 2
MPWGSGESASKSRTFNCRMLIKPPGEESDEVEVKQTQLSQFENMQISAFLQPVPRDKEENVANDAGGF